MTKTVHQEVVTSDLLVTTSTNNSVFESGKISFYKVDQTPKRQRRRSGGISGVGQSTCLRRGLLCCTVLLGIFFGLSHLNNETSFINVRRSLRIAGLSQAEMVAPAHENELERRPRKQAENLSGLQRKNERSEKNTNNKNHTRMIDLDDEPTGPA